MLKGTKRKPDEVLWVVPPRQGVLTVELVATLGVMAGSKPEHMPLLLAAVEAMSKPEVGLARHVHHHRLTYPMFVISGPIIEKLGLNPGTGTAGGGNPATNTLGHFVNLVGDVVGGPSPQPGQDHTRLFRGPGGHGLCGKRQGKSWQSFAVQQGFTDKDSLITISTSYLPNGNIDHGSDRQGTAEHLCSRYRGYGFRHRQLLCRIRQRGRHLV